MAATNFKSLRTEQINEFLNSFDTVLVDCDESGIKVTVFRPAGEKCCQLLEYLSGVFPLLSPAYAGDFHLLSPATRVAGISELSLPGVLWVQTTPLPNSVEVINTFQNLGKRVFYVTNNSTRTREELAEKCKIFHFKACKEDILCTAHMAATYLKNISFHRKVYVIGKTGITKELDKVGIPHCGVGPDVMGKDLSTLKIEKDPDVGAVIVGFDDHFSYPKLVKAASYLADHDVHFIATETDIRVPISNHFLPCTGCLVRCIETCVERKATVMGKPEPYVADVIKKQYNVDPKRTLMIGDNANTDILLGTRCGFKTMLVLSGVTTLDDVEKWEKSSAKEERDLVPDYYIDTLGDLFPHLQKYKPLSRK